MASVLLSALFIVVYGACNWITSWRTDVGSIQFQWERSIPVIPWLILPYMSIDLFFIWAPFMCRTAKELRVLAQRLLMATLVAGICFLLIPLHLADARPQLSGSLGVIHNFLKWGDQPYNLFPSLHVTYLLILWPHYHRHIHGILRLSLHAWFGLVLLSPVLVGQHHFIDVVGGIVVAVTCLYAIPDNPAIHLARNRVSPRPKIALRYAAGGIVAMLLAYVLGIWGFVAAWIALSLIIMACAYAFAGAAVYRKSNGRIPIPARLLLAPAMIGLYATRLYWFTKSRQAFQEVDRGVWMGQLLTDRQAATLVAKAPIAAVLDMTAEHAAPRVFRKMTYKNVPILDLTTPSLDQLRDAATFIERHIAQDGVYVYCGLGYSRSAAAVAAYLLLSGRAENPESACDMIRTARPHVVLSSDSLELLHKVQDGHCGGS